jgi:GAF domain-containing protein
VALRKGNVLLGQIVAARREVRPFTNEQIALLQNFATQAVIAMENARLLNETREALDQQTATAEVLGVINSSPGQLGPVFDAILEKAHSLCGAASGGLMLIEDNHYRAVAVHGDPGLAEYWLDLGWIPFPTGDDTLFGRLSRGEIVHLRDASVDDGTRKSEQYHRLVELAGARSLVMFPLRKDDVLFGIITAFRRELQPFSDKQIALLRNFAAQAVIAMENARLLTETREALEQQTATAEVLQVINSSPGDLKPVFNEMLEKAMRLCDASIGGIYAYEGDSFRAVALSGVPEAYADFLHSEPLRPLATSGLGRIEKGELLVHIEDVTAEEAYGAHNPSGRTLLELGQARTVLLVSLRKDGALLGVIFVYRTEVRPFTEKQIALLENFAAQAVIAMENARLLTETREALEQQTATAEVLQVINSSPGDLTPVFDAMLEKAMRLCEAQFGGLTEYNGEAFNTVALRGIPSELADIVSAPQRAHPGSNHERLVRGEALVHISDLAAPGVLQTQASQSRGMAEIGGARTALLLALRKDEALLGSIWLYRQEVRPFTEKQIALLQNFAAQAVIAMENARLITETREALEQQTATSEVLQVINSSPGDLTPVFDTMLDKALHLCEAAFGLLSTYDGEQFHSVAQHGVPEEFVQRYLREPFRTAPNTTHDRLIRNEHLVHVTDLAAEEIDNPRRRAVVEVMGARTILGVALRKDGTLLGAIHLYRKEVHPFSDKQIALLQNFAAQAVIAMENARLLTETREALEQQTATADVLQVINSSPGDLTPVFDAMLDKAMRLCEAVYGELTTHDGERFHTAALRGVPAEYAKYKMHNPPNYGAGSAPMRLLAGERVVHIIDVKDSDLYRQGDPNRRALVGLGGARSLLTVPLLKDSVVLGTIMIYRHEVRPFADKQIALLQNFAAQAVIAMENARLLNELQDRTHDLEESLEYQTATSDVLQVISRSTFDLQPVLDTLVQTAAGLCSADMGLISGREEAGMRVTATFSTTPEYETFIRGRLLPLTRGSLTGRVFVERTAVQIPDLTADPEFTVTETVTLGKMRTALGVPLMREGEVIGAISLARQRVEPFTQRQLELVRTFADQAVIAIENTRLITETREALEQQQAMAEILQEINRSPGNLQPVFDILLNKAMQLCGAAFGIMRVEGPDQFSRIVSAHGVPPEFTEFSRRYPVPPRHRGNAARLRGGEAVVHDLDLKDNDLYWTGDPQRRALVDLAGARTSLAVALRKDRQYLGAIQVYRQEVRAFAEKEIALLESFAAQAVIAMDNARLLDEIRQRQAELRVTFDNMGDGVAMFDGELRLAAWNLNFQRILELPDPLLAERPRVEEFVRYLATHGEFGVVDLEAEVRRLTERVGTQWSAERVRPDGRVIEVRSNPVPGGGVVLIYSDVTERKRAEAEIRAARDTAEKALQELQTTQASLVHAQKMAALGQLTAGIAHEIKNPLNFVNNFAELSGELLVELKETTAPAVAALGDDERAAVDEVVEMLRGNLDKIAEHGKRADGIVKSMLEHSRGVSGERRVVDLNALIEEALNLAYHGARAQDASFNITLERDFDRGLVPTELAPQEMTRVFLNLFGNGFYATAKRQRDGAGSEFRPTLRVTTQDLGDVVEVRVRDNGTGISPEIRDKLFQPFVTTKPTGEGTGLGLSIAWDIVTQQHGGTISVDSQVGKFTEFTIRLPCAYGATTAVAVT